MPWSESIVNLPWMTITKMEDTNPVRVEADYTGPVSCPHCASTRLRKKAPFVRTVRHESVGQRLVWLILRGYKYLCVQCHRYFRQRFPGLLSYQRATEPFKSEVCQDHHDGICQSRLAQRMQMGTATIERWYHRFLERKMAERVNDLCPRVLGIDEHFFTRKDGYATTLCDLQKHRVFDVVLGRSEAALDGYLNRLRGKERVRVVCMDLSSTYRSVVRKHFPRALIVADRFHVIRLIGHHIHQLWRQIDPSHRWNRGLLSLLRRRADRLDAEQVQTLEVYLQAHPAIAALYRFKQELWELLRPGGLAPRSCRPRIREFLARIHQLKEAIFPSLVSLGHTLEDWQEEIVRMWRFSRNNGITEGFHTKMEMISRRAFGFKNFDNYRLRVRACCC
jgi:transposase